MRETELPWINEAVRLDGAARLDGKRGYVILHTTGNYLYTGGRTEPPLELSWYPYNSGAVSFDGGRTMNACVTYVDDKRLIVETPAGKKEITRLTSPVIARWADDMSIAMTIRRATKYAEGQKDRILLWLQDGENNDDLARSLTYMILDYIDGNPEDSDKDHAIEVACVLLGQDQVVLEALGQAEYI